MDGVAVVEVGDVPHACQASGAAGRVRAGHLPRPRCAANGASQGSSSDDSTTSSSGQTDRAGSHGSVSRSMPIAAATAPLTSRPGKGNSMFAQTPSLVPAMRRAGREPLGQPALDTASRHGDDLGLHRVVQRRTDDVAELVDKPVGPFCAVDVEQSCESSSA